MKFAKDILIVDFEGGDEPVQIGAVLLDRETLAEKESFVSYIFADLPAILPLSAITQATLNNAPTQKEVAQMIIKKFGTNYFLGSWVANKDMSFFRKIMAAAGYSWDQFDYHVLDVWPIAYVDLLKHGYKGGVGSEDMFQAFGLPPRGFHDALEDARYAASILHKLSGSREEQGC